MGVDTEEIAQENPTIIYHCAKNYNPEKKSKFSSWLANNVRYNCLNYLYKTKPNLSIEDQDLSDILMNLQSEGTNYKDKKEFIFGILAQMKDPRLEKIIELRYFGDKESKKWKNIAAALDTSYMTVSVLHKKALKFLKSKMNSNFLADFI
jgi:RNA polymerase sigma factor (sigma-70 family)